MAVAGVDLSTRSIDLVVIDDDTGAATWRHVPLVEGGPWRATRSVRTVFPTRRWFEEQGVYLIGMEDPFGQSMRSVKALGMVTGAVLALLPRDIPVLEMPPQEWKRETLRKANAKKEHVAAWAATLGFAPGDLNATDAYGIAWAARRLNERALNPGAAA